LKPLRSTEIVDAHGKNAYLDCMTPEQCRAARGWLDWGQQELADAARVSLSTVRDFEKGRRVPIANNLAAMRAALDAKGIAFVDDERTCGISVARKI
jgi:transcriptional regulator with XRE-family HTH domain